MDYYVKRDDKTKIIQYSKNKKKGLDERLSDADAELKAILNPVKDLETRRLEEYNKRGATPEAWMRAIIQRDEDSDLTEYNSLKAIRDQVKLDII